MSGQFPTLLNGLGDPLVCVKVFGDVGSSSEVFRILGEDGIEYGVTKNTSDCSDYTEETCFSINASIYDTWISDDTVILSLDPLTNLINPNLCVTNEACGRIVIPQLIGCPTDTVISNTDAGDGSLRSLIECAQTGDTIFLNASMISDTIVLTSPIVIQKSITIIGIHGTGVTIQADQILPIFNIAFGHTVHFKNFQLVPATSTDPGRAILNAGILRLENIQIEELEVSGGTLIQNTDEIEFIGIVYIRQ